MSGPFGRILRGVFEALGGGVLGAAHAFAPASPERHLRLQFCLELFTGYARFACALGKRGYYCIATDIRWGDDHNLVDSKLRATILGWVLAKVILIVLAGFICLSFSKPRNMPGGPPPLRDSQSVAGCPDFCSNHFV